MELCARQSANAILTIAETVAGRSSFQPQMKINRRSLIFRTSLLISREIASQQENGAPCFYLQINSQPSTGAGFTSGGLTMSIEAKLGTNRLARNVFLKNFSANIISAHPNEPACSWQLYILNCDNFTITHLFMKKPVWAVCFDWQATVILPSPEMLS